MMMLSFSTERATSEALLEQKYEAYDKGGCKGECGQEHFKLIILFDFISKLVHILDLLFLQISDAINEGGGLGGDFSSKGIDSVVDLLITSLSLFI